MSRSLASLHMRSRMSLTYHRERSSRMNSSSARHALCRSQASMFLVASAFSFSVLETSQRSSGRRAALMAASSMPRWSYLSMLMYMVAKLATFHRMFRVLRALFTPSFWNDMSSHGAETRSR